MIKLEINARINLLIKKKYMIIIIMTFGNLNNDLFFSIFYNLSLKTIILLKNINMDFLNTVNTYLNYLGGHNIHFLSFERNLNYSDDILFLSSCLPPFDISIYHTNPVVRYYVNYCQHFNQILS